MGVVLWIQLKTAPENDGALAAILAGGVRLMADEKFCSSCRRYKPDAQIYSKKVTVLRRGKAIHYLCVTCAETIRARTEKSSA